MPKGPKGEKRPADVIGNAVMVAKIATGEIEEEFGPEGTKPGKDATADLGKPGGTAQANNRTHDQRGESARNAAASRWGKPE